MFETSVFETVYHTVDRTDDEWLSGGYYEAISRDPFETLAKILLEAPSKPKRNASRDSKSPAVQSSTEAPAP